MYKRVLLPVLLVFVLFFMLPVSLQAAEDTSALPYSTERVNDETGYRAVVSDEAGLLSENALKALLQEMMPVTDYGNVLFKTVSENAGTAYDRGVEIFQETFGMSTVSGVMLFIDMDNREIYIISDGAVYQTVTDQKAEVITDNIYRYAGDGDYYGCASEAFREIGSLLAGGKIAEPMKHISNALLALLCAFLINFLIVHSIVSLKAPSNRELLTAAENSFHAEEADVTHTGQTKRYAPVQTSSGGGRSSGGGFSGGGGGGHSGGFSGGGGGHKF